MITVDGEVFYHVHRRNHRSDKWVEGGRLQFGYEDNHFYWGIKRDLDEPHLLHRGNDLCSQNANYIHERRGLPPFPDLQNISERDLAIFMMEQEDMWERMAELNYSVSKHRQYIFENALEEYRLQHHPEFPSRLRGLWVFRLEEHPWNEYLEKDGNVLFELQLYGKIHRADGSFIDACSYPITEYKRIAEDYWTGKLNPNEGERQIEYLFEGEARVLRSIKK